MRTRIQEWGNSLGLRIPKSFAEEAGVETGSDVDLSIEDGELIVRPRRSPRYELKDLLEGVTAKNVHDEIETCEPVGREIWLRVAIVPTPRRQSPQVPVEPSRFSKCLHARPGHYTQTS